MDEKELSYRFQVFEQQINYIQEQLNFIDQALVDMINLKQGLEEIKSKKEKEILSPLGRGVFVKSKIISDDIIVEIGNKNLVTKTIPETKELIEEQIKRIEENKEKLEEELKKIEEEMKILFLESQKGHIHNHECKCGHEHGENCECEDEED